jgi:glycosyltransferase involved in cell wall biosynthesis
VAVCTRDRPDDLGRCLAALAAQAHPAAEILVIDNASRDASTRNVCGRFPVRYVREDVAGLNWARRRAVLEARSEVIAFTDDDAVPDPRWLAEMLRPFASDSVGATSGLALPLELETDGQEGFERSCPMSRGFLPRAFDAQSVSPLAAANAGLGASMAIRLDLARRLRLFEADLDAGTAAKSGGDTYAFYLLLRLGHRIAYSPDALVWHRHRRTRQELVDVLRNYSIGTYVFLLRCLVLHGEFGALGAGAGWFLKHHVKQFLRALLRRPQATPLSITLAEIGGVLQAPVALVATLRRERRLLRGFGQETRQPASP